MKKKFIVELTTEERSQLQSIVGKGKAAAYKILHANILLKADQGSDGPGWKDRNIAEAFGCHRTTVENLRKQLVTQGFEAALERTKRGPQLSKRKLDGRGEALLIALGCSQAPEGRNRWTLRLLAEGLVELGVVDSISYETVREVLKKTSSNPTSINIG